MTTRRARILIVGGLILASCDSETTGGASTTSSVESTTTEATIAPTTIAPTTVAPTTVAPTTTVPGELFFVDGALLGIKQFTEVSFAEGVLGVTAVPFDETTFHTREIACTNTPGPMEIQTGGLTLVYETYTPTGEVLLTNWIYVGGPAMGYTGIVAPGDVRIGDPRSAVEAANPGFVDIGGGLIDSYDPFPLRYGVESGNLDWFGIIDCIFEEL